MVPKGSPGPSARDYRDDPILRHATRRPERSDQKDQRGVQSRKENDSKRDRSDSRKLPEREPESLNQEELPSSEKLRNEVVVKAIAHPLTSVPLFISFISFASLIALMPIGGPLAAVGLGVGSGIFGAANGAWRFFTGQKEYDEKAAKVMEEKMRREKEAEQRKVTELKDSLRTGFLKTQWRDEYLSQAARRGLKEVNDLVSASEIVAQEVERSKEGMFSLDIIARVAPRAKEVFKEGLTLLSDLLGLMHSVQSEDENVLREEIAELERDIKKLKEESGEYGQRIIAIKQNSLLSKKARLEKIFKHRELMELLLCRADDCESALRTAKDDLVKMKAESSEDALAETLNRLKQCINTALEVRKQLREEGLNV